MGEDVQPFHALGEKHHVFFHSQECKEGCVLFQREYGRGCRLHEDPSTEPLQVVNSGRTSLKEKERNRGLVGTTAWLEHNEHQGGARDGGSQYDA